MTELYFFAITMFGGILRIGPALIWAVAGDCLTQRSGHFNLGLEGLIATSAMTAVLVSTSSSPYMGVFIAALVGGVFALVFVLLSSLPRVNELGIGIALLVAGIAIAQFVGSSLIAKPITLLPSFHIGATHIEISIMLPLALLAIVGLSLVLAYSRFGILLLAVGDRVNEEKLKLTGMRPWLIRWYATIVGGMFGGVSGACLGLFYPGGWSDQLTTGIGIVTVTLVFLAKTKLWWATLAAILFSALSALGPALQVSFGISNFHLFNVLPYGVTLIVLALTHKKKLA